MIPFYFKIEIFAVRNEFVTLGHKGLNCIKWYNMVTFQVKGNVLLINLVIVQELAIKKRHQAYRIAAIVHIARLKPKS